MYNKFVFFSIILILLFCACNIASQNENNPNNIHSLPEKNSNILDSIPENSKKNERKILGTINEYKIYTENHTNGTRFDLVLNKEKIPVPMEVPNTEYYIVDSVGVKIIEHPFDYCFLYSPQQMFSHPEYYTLSGSYNGNSYKYIFKDGKFEEYLFEPAGEMGEEHFGYRLTRYCWYNEYLNYGINDSEGNVVFEPVYTKIEMPFEDRFLLCEGSQGMFNSQGEGRYLIADTKGNILAMYSYITYKIFDDDSYLGIASVAGGNSVKCYDDNGNFLPEGYYFVDRDGKRLSQRFESLSINGGSIFAISSKNEMITAMNENGKETVFSVNDYICGV